MLAFGGALAVAAAADLAFGGPTLNLSNSVPTGLYWLQRGPAQRGDMVEVCPREDVARYLLGRGVLPAGWCPAGTAPLMKVLAAVAGDVVDVESTGVWINGERWPMSAPLQIKSLPFAAPRGRFRLAAGQVFILGLSPRAFDSRYLGSIPATDVIGRATPLLTQKAQVR
jgi:conjugative transfer signal peptidase TraF